VIDDHTSYIYYVLFLIYDYHILIKILLFLLFIFIKNKFLSFLSPPLKISHNHALTQTNKKRRKREHIKKKSRVASREKKKSRSHALTLSQNE